MGACDDTPRAPGHAMTPGATLGYHHAMPPLDPATAAPLVAPLLRMATAPLALASGMRDMLPPRAAHRKALARAVLTAFRRFGYDLVVPPVFEREEVVARGLGARAGGDLVRLLDPDTGEVMVLRPDMTPQIARIVATRYRDVPAPIRLAYEGSVIRQPRGRARRHRQVAQAGIECVGWHGLDADVEVLTAVTDALAGVGAQDYRVELSHAGIAAAALAEVPEALRDDVADALSARDGTTWTKILAGHPGVAGRLDTLVSLAGDVGVLDRASAALPGPGHARALADLRAVAEALTDLGLGERLLVDLGEVRGIGYYTGMQFQVLCPGVGSPVASGGRYDDLLGRYGAPRPATGCAIDLESLEDALAAHGAEVPDPEPPRVVVAGERAHRRGRSAALRAAGSTVAELDATDVRTVLAWALAHGYDTAWVCSAAGAAEIKVAPGP